MKIEIDRIDLTENKTDLPGKWFQEGDNPRASGHNGLCSIIIRWLRRR